MKTLSILMMLPLLAYGSDWNATTASWFSPTNWTAGVPAANTLARVNNGGTATIGYGDAVAGLVYLAGTGTGSKGDLTIGDFYWSFSFPAPTLRTAGLYVGDSGIGNLTIQDGASVRTESIYTTSLFNQTVIGNSPGSQGTISVVGTYPAGTIHPPSFFDTTQGKPFLIGLSGIGNFYVKNGGVAISDDAFIGNGYDSEGYALVSGVSYDHSIPSSWSCNYLGVGSNAALGFLGVSDGGTVNSEILQINARQGAVSPTLGSVSLAHVQGAGSSLEITGLLTMNGFSSGICGMNILDSAQVFAGEIELAHVAGGVSVINLTGTPGEIPGTLKTSKITKGQGIAELGFDGGCLAATESIDDMFLKEDGVTTDFSIKLVSRGAVIDTQEFDVGIGSPLIRDIWNESNGPGGLTKIGTGTLTLRGASTYAGSTEILEGKLILGDLAVLKSVTNVYPGATLGGTGLIDNAVNIGGAIVPGMGSAGSLRTGYASISGTLATCINGASSNRLEVSGNLSFSPGSSVTVVGPATVGSSWVIATATGSISGLPAAPVGFTVSIDSSANPKRVNLRYDASSAPQMFEPLQAFRLGPETPQAKVLQASDGNFYGTSVSGGSGYGTVFRVTRTGMLTTLVNFNNTNGSYPYAGLVQGSDGNFYGTTSSGGSNNYGTVFRMTPNGALTTLVSFTSTNGSSPSAGLVQGSDGNFYGTTESGGSGGYGTVFRITPTGTLTTLVNFNGTNGRDPKAALVQGNDGNFYGTTYGQVGRFAGIKYGTVFMMTPAGTITTLVNFTGDNGGNPSAALVRGSNGNFYGTTSNGGSSGGGTVFEMTTTGVLTTMVNFSDAYATANGSHPISELIQGSDGNFYGTTPSGGFRNVGTVFKMTPSGALTILWNCVTEYGTVPEAALLLGSDGNFYGTTTNSDSGYGTVFRMTPVGTLSTLVNFSENHGSDSFADLVQGTDGDFYGTTAYGGSSDCGTVFKVAPSGVLTTLVNFTNINGRSPHAALVQGSDGNFYGTTSSGGGSGYGTVFRMTPIGTLTTLVDFNNTNGSYPYAGLVQGNDGNFYGTTSSGGSGGYGTVFRMTPAGTLTNLVSFIGTNGSNPYGCLVQGNDGNFYGTTNFAGSGGYGTVFKMTPAGTLTTLVNFNNTNGSYPSGGLVQGGDGNFYGTTSSGGSGSYGTVFKMTPAGTLTTLVNFNNTNGGFPYAGLVQGNDGNFYGTTVNGGSSGYGTVFKMSPPGALTTLVNFAASNGSYPYAGLVKGSDGNLYGITKQGGITSDDQAAGGGQIFRLRLGTAAQNTYSSWASSWFSSVQLADPLVGGLDADPDHDGVPNVLERAFNLNPTQSALPILTADTGTTGLPLIRRTGEPPAFSIQYLRRKASSNSGLTYTPQFGSSLDDSGWSPATGTETVQSIDSEWERVTIQEDASGKDKRFGRVKVVSGE